MKVASFNVLNYFTTLEVPGACGPSNLECRGANTAEELSRQRAKIVSAMARIDADVLGLIEIQNDSGAAVADLVAGLNAAIAPGTYAYVDTGTIGGDAIKTALVYRAATVTPVGPSTVLDLGGRSPLRRHPQPPGADPDVRAEGHRRPGHDRPQPLQVQGVGVRGHRRPRPGRRPGQLQRHPHGGGRALARLPGHRPHRQRRGRRAHHGRPELLRQEDPITALVAGGYTDLVALQRYDAYSYLFDGNSAISTTRSPTPPAAPGGRGGRLAHQRRRDPAARLQRRPDRRRSGLRAGIERPAALPGRPFRSSHHYPVLIGLNLVRRCPAAAA